MSAATAQFHRVEVAEQAGHQLGYIAPFLLNHCIAHPTAGAMGYHWFDHDAIHDIALDPRRPEGLVYEPGPNGQLNLVAVEWIVPAEAWHAAGNTEPPSVLGQEMGNSQSGPRVVHPPRLVVEAEPCRDVRELEPGRRLSVISDASAHGTDAETQCGHGRRPHPRTVRVMSHTTRTVRGPAAWLPTFP